MRITRSLTLAAGALAAIAGLASAGQTARAFPAFAPDNASASLVQRVVEARKYRDSNESDTYNRGGYDQGVYPQGGFAGGGFAGGDDLEGGYPQAGYYNQSRRTGGYNGDDNSYDPAATAYGPSYRTRGGTKPYAGGYDFENYPPGSPGAQELRQRRFEFCQSSPSRC